MREKGLKFEVKLSLLGMELCMCYTLRRKYPSTQQKDILWLEVGIHEFTTWVIGVGESSASRSGRFTIE